MRSTQPVHLFTVVLQALLVARHVERAGRLEQYWQPMHLESSTVTRPVASCLVMAPAGQMVAHARIGAVLARTAPEGPFHALVCRRPPR